MAEKVILSEQGKLKWRDVLKGAALSAGSAVASLALDSLMKGELEFNWKLMATTGLGVFISYLFKNGVFEKAQVTTIYASNQQAKVVSEDIKSTQ